MDSWLYRPLWIIVLSLTVLGPFAIPLVQRSPYLSPAGKKIMNLAIVLYTVLVLIASIYLVLFFLSYFSNLATTLDSGLF